MAGMVVIAWRVTICWTQATSAVVLSGVDASTTQNAVKIM